MKIFYTSLCSLLLGSYLSANADSTVVTTVSGNPDTRELVYMTFDGDNVVLNFSDNTSQTADMAEVAIALTHDEQSAITNIRADQSKPAGVYNLKGQRLADTPDGLHPGIYIVNGEKVVVK